MAVDLEQDVDRRERLRAIKDARDFARRIERKADDDGEEPIEAGQHWRTVRDLAKKAFAADIKDLEMAAYLIEAAVRLEGFAGVRDGFQLARELVESSWDDLHPMPDETEGVVVRVLPLTRLNGEEGEGLLIGPLNRVPITQGRTFGPYSPWHHQQADDFSKLSDRERASRDEQGAVTPDRFKQAVKETETSFFKQLVDDIAACQAEFESLNKSLDEKCGRDDNGHSLAPPTSAIRNAFEQILLGVQSFAKDRLPAPSGSVAAMAAGGSSPAAGQASSGHVAVDPQGATRDDAFRWLTSAAEYFERTEPQSLLPAQIRKIIRWGRLPADEYHQELLEDPSVIERLFKLVGIKLKENDGSENS